MKKYRIQVIGQPEPVIVDKELGKKIKKIYDDENVEGNEQITTDEFSIKKSSIRSIVMFDDQVTEHAEPETASRKKEIEHQILHLKEIKKRLAQSIEQRAKNLGAFNLMYFTLANKDAPQDVLQKAEEKQLAYFQKYPEMPTANPMIFRELVQEEGQLPINHYYAVKGVTGMIAAAYASAKKTYGKDINALLLDNQERYKNLCQELGVNPRERCL